LSHSTLIFAAFRSWVAESPQSGLKLKLFALNLEIYLLQCAALRGNCDIQAKFVTCSAVSIYYSIS